jgi:hypothetical protein
MSVRKAFVLLKAWSDPWENNAANAFGYSAFAVAMDLTTAERLLSESPRVTKKKYGWPAHEGEPSINYQEVDLIE